MRFAEFVHVLMQQVLEIHKQQPAGQVVSTVSCTES